MTISERNEYTYDGRALKWNRADLVDNSVYKIIKKTSENFNNDRIYKPTKAPTKM